MFNNSEHSTIQYQSQNPRILVEDDNKISTESLVVFFLFGGLMIAGFVREINKKTSIPYTPMLFVIGMFVGKFSESMGILGTTVSKISTINPHGILMIFLPILIFESGFNSDWHTFKKQSGQIFLLAFPCVLFSAIFLLISIKVILRYDDSYYTWSGAFMFGSILSCTDTVAVLALLKEVGAPKKFNSLIEGESLLNDGTCMVLFQISSDYAKKIDINTQSQQYFDLFEVIKLTLSLTVGGVALGIFFGMIAQFWIRRIHNDPILTVNVTFIICYMTYYVAENVDLGIKVSGIMALVSLGIYLSIFGKTKISSEEKRTVYIFWKYVTYAGESIIFILAGILVGVKVLTNSGEYDSTVPGADVVVSTIKTSDYFKLLGLYLCMILSRFGSIACFMSWLRKWGYGLTWKEVYVLAYGGLRGAIGISFAMIVANDDSYSQKLRDIILFDMAGNAILTLIINGTTTGPLIRSLGLCVTSTVRERVFLNILQDLKEDTEKKVNYLKSNNYLKMVNWDSVKEYVGLADLEQRIKRLDDDLIKREEIEEYTKNIRNKNAIDAKIDELKNSNDFQDQQSFDSDSTNHNLDENMIVECRNRFLMALKGNYWEIYDRNQCSSNALLLLIDSVNWDLDTEQERMNSWEFLSNYFYNPLYIKVLFQLKGWPIVGSYAGNMLFNHISNIYDVISAYIEAHELAEQLCIEQFPFIPQVLEIIIRESQDNRMSGEEYIKNDLNVSFPEITKQIQTKKATYSLLECQRKIIKKGLLLGQIDDKERDILMQQIDDKIVALDNIKPSWKAPPIKNFLENVPFFKLIHKDLLPYLIKESVEMIFEKDMYIIKEGEKAKYFFVITRGSATETTSQSFCTYQEKKEVGSLISPHHLVVPGLRYLTSCMADAVVYVLAFPISSIQKVIKVNFEIKEYVWMQSLRALSQLFYNELKPLGSLDRNSFNKLIPKLKFSKYNKGKTIQCESGGILLKGQVSRKDLTDIMMNQSKINTDDRRKTETLEGRVYKSFFVLMPGMAFSLYTEKKCTFIHFAEDCEEIRFMMGHHDYQIRLSSAQVNPSSILSPLPVSANIHKRNSFQAPHLSRFGGRKSTTVLHNFEVIVQNSERTPGYPDLSRMKSRQHIDEKIKSIKSDDEESDDNKDK